MLDGRMHPARRRSAIALFVAYSAVHVGWAGVWRPWHDHGIVQTEQEGRVLIAYAQTGRPIAVDPGNPRQYGPAYLFLLHPILWVAAKGDVAHFSLESWTPGGVAVSRALYVPVAASLVLCIWWLVASILVLARERGWPRDTTMFAIGSVVLLCTNFSPMYEILEVKNVEAWEVCLIGGGMYAYVSRRPAWAGACIGAAALMKVLPGFFFLFLLIRDRKAFVYGCLTVAGLLLAGHIVYGPPLGLAYPLLVLKAAGGYTLGFTGIANISIKGMIAKALGHLQAPMVGVDMLKQDPRTGYYVALTPGQLYFANLAGNLCQVALVAWFIYVLVRARSSVSGAYQRLWEWSLASMVMLIATPLIGYEYSLLVMPAFCVATVAVLVDPDVKTTPAAAGLWCVAIFLVANIIPRQIVERIIPVRLFARWSGYSHLSPPELYNQYGFPMLGLVSLLLALWLIRPALVVAGAQQREFLRQRGEPVR